MNESASIMDRLFGLKSVRWSDPRTVLGWQTPLPGWAWALIVIGAVLLAAWSYHRLLGGRWARLSLAMVRALLIVLVAALLAGPMLVLKQEHVEPDCLLVLVDRSASLNIKDMPAQLGADGLPLTGVESLISRDEALRRALAAHPDLFGPGKLGGEHRQVIWLGFDSGTYEIEGPRAEGLGPRGEEDQSSANVDVSTNDASATTNNAPSSPGPRPQALGPSSGAATALRTAIEQALQRVAGRPISGIILFTDGRSPEATGADLVRRLNQQSVGVYAVPLGAATAPLDLAIAEVDAPDKAFVNDKVPVKVWVETYPDDADIDSSRVHVRLLDAQTGAVLDEQPGAAPGEPVRLTAQSKTVGRVTWRVELTYDSRPAEAQHAELITENNQESVSLELVDRPIRVLYVEGYPRWEYRYLKNMLIREKSISSSMMLLSADRAFAQEGDVPITRLPKDAAELEPFDVIIIGDVASSYFGADMMALIRDHVAVRGAGLLWIGGPGNTPRSYETTALADLLPMRLPGAVDRLGGVTGAGGAFAMRPTHLAEIYNVLRLQALTGVAGGAAGGSDNNSASLWPGELPLMQWGQDLGPLKQIAEVLADTGSRVQGGSQDGSAQSAPLVVRMPYGAGLSLYVATDETWRWRFGRGEYYFEQFWVQLVRMLASNRLQQDSGAVRMHVSHRRVQRDQAVVVELVVRDPLMLKRDLPRIAVDVTRADDPDARALERIELTQEDAPGSPPPGTASGDDAGGRPDDPMSVSRGRTYRAVWRPAATGSLRLRVVEPALADLDLTDIIEVYHPDDEKRQPLPDHQRLTTLAEQTHGRVVPLVDLEQLAEQGLIPKRAIPTPNDVRESLWDSYLTLAAVLLLLTIEWVGRKIIRLV